MTWEEVAETLRSLIDDCEMLEDASYSDRARDFAASVRRQAEDMLDRVTRFRKCTDGQRRAVSNWSEAVGRWLPTVE